MTSQKAGFHTEKHWRRSIRLRGYDYSSEGAYFVTICIQNRKLLLGEVVADETVLSEYGRVIAECWDDLPRHYPHVELDAFMIMPNHVHGIIVLNDVGAQFIAPNYQGVMNHAPTLGEIIRTFKAMSTRLIRKTDQGTINRAPTEFGWQRNYYEHIIRNEDELSRIRQYIIDNPARWSEDEENPEICRGRPMCLP